MLVRRNPQPGVASEAPSPSDEMTTSECVVSAQQISDMVVDVLAIAIRFADHCAHPDCWDIKDRIHLDECPVCSAVPMA